MRIRTLLATGAVVLAISPAGAVAATDGDGDGGAQGPPDHVLDLARGAAAQAQGVARGLTDDLGEAGTPRGVGSAAFRQRHAELAEKHAEHPGNAAAVHAAMAAGDHPSTAKGNGRDAAPGQRRKAEVHQALRDARDLFDDDRPGLGLGRKDGD